MEEVMTKMNLQRTLKLNTNTKVKAIEIESDEVEVGGWMKLPDKFFVVVIYKFKMYMKCACEYAKLPHYVLQLKYSMLPRLF